MSRVLPTIVETSIFSRRAEKLLTADERDELMIYLSTFYAAGDEIQGTGGVRKLRFAAQARGKSGGVRVIYYFYDELNPLYAMLLYGKNEQASLSPDQKKYVTDMAAFVKSSAKARRNNQ